MAEKMALFCNVDKDCVIQNLDAPTLYEVPLMLEAEGLADIACRKLNLENHTPDLSEWTAMVEREKGIGQKMTRIALVGKYVELHDAYISVVESLKHAGIHHEVNVDIKWINSEHLDHTNSDEAFADVDGILVPGGFGDRGIEGKIIAVKYARTHKKPFFGICLGMQCVVIEYARNVLGLEGAHSSELNPETRYPVIDIMPEQKDIDELGGTMRLGAYPCKVSEGSKASQAYGEALIYERHRHRYEYNNEFREQLTTAGLKITGVSPDERLVEMVEIEDHPWFVGVQFHPEFKSRPNRSHPLFRDFIGATLSND
jgi:CTP synthase